MSTELEDLLRQLPLRKPSPRLHARLFGGPVRRGMIVRLVLAGGAIAAAAAVVLAVAIHQPRTRPIAPAPPPAEIALPAQPPAQADPLIEPSLTDSPAEPARTEQHWTRLYYDGSIRLGDGPPLRAFRRESIRQVRWVDADGAAMEVTVPQEQIILVSAETY